MEKTNSESIKAYVSDAELLFAIPIRKKFADLVIPEFSFDLQLLNLSPLYKHSRELYLDLV